MNYAGYLSKAGFAYGFGKSLGVVVGLATGAGIIFATGAILIGGAFALKDYKKKKAKKAEETV